MSAQMTYESVTEEQHAYYEGPHATICAACHHADPDPSYERQRGFRGACDRCGTAFIYSVEIVEGMAWIEHIPVRIF